MKTPLNGICRAALLAGALLPNHVFAQATPPLSVCTGEAKAPACDAARGDRADGWRAQSRAEVMAPHGMVTTSQPLAAQAGLQMMLRGGNAVDAAVATAAVLNLVEPMMTGVAGDLFAIIYVAKKKKLYVLNASGRASSGATVERFASLGYRADPTNWGPGSGMPVYGILPVTVPGSAWGWEEVVKRFGKLSFKEVLQPAIDYAENGFPVSQRIANDWRYPMRCRSGSAAAHSIRIRWRLGTSTENNQSPAKYSAIPISRRPFGCCSSTAAMRFTKARSPRQSWRNQMRLGAA